MQRITQNGQQVWPPKPRITKRDPRGRFANGGAKRFFIGLLILAAILLVTLFAPVFSGWLDRQNKQSTLDFIALRTPVAYAAVTPQANFEEKIEALKNDIVARLTDCENGNFTEADAIVIWDNNSGDTLTGKNIPSYGELQWKVGTVIGEAKARDGKILTPKQAKLLAFETQEAQRLAKFTIFDHPGKGIEHWHNCANNPKFFPNGGKAEVDIIKKLTN